MLNTINNVELEPDWDERFTSFLRQMEPSELPASLEKMVTNIIQSEDLSDAVFNEFKVEGTPEVKEIVIYQVQHRRLGIGFQIWPAALFLCEYLRDHPDILLPSRESKSESTQSNNGESQLQSESSQTKPESSDASQLLAKSLRSQPLELEKVTFLELGAGTGLCGLYVAALGARAILTDLPAVLPGLKRNIEINPHLTDRVQVTNLAWGTDDADTVKKNFSFRSIIVADCVYWEHLYHLLIDSLNVREKKKEQREKASKGIGDRYFRFHSTKRI